MPVPNPTSFLNPNLMREALAEAHTAVEHLLTERDALLARVTELKAALFACCKAVEDYEAGHSLDADAVVESPDETDVRRWMASLGAGNNGCRVAFVRGAEYEAAHRERGK